MLKHFTNEIAPSSAVILHMQDKFRSVPLVYFYFDAAEVKKRCAEDMLSSIICQLIKQDKSRLDEVIAWASASQHHSGSSFKIWQAPTTLKMLVGIFTRICEEKQIFMVVDAADESNDLKAVLLLLIRIEKLGVRVLFSSRPNVAVNRVFSAHESPGHVRIREISITPARIASDIKLYVSGELDHLLDTKEVTLSNPHLKSEIIGNLTSRAEGL